MQDHYATLGIKRRASADEVKKAYRRLAKQCHPDLHPGDQAAEERFKAIGEAHEVLSDRTRRRAYDRDLVKRARTAKKTRRTATPRAGAAKPAQDAPGATARRAKPAASEGDEIRLTLRQAYDGIRLERTVSVEFECGSCHGRRTECDELHACPDCRGLGILIVRHPLTGRPAASACAECGGVGLVKVRKCRACGGAGVRRRRIKGVITIPPGIADGDVLRLRVGEGLAKVRVGVAGSKRFLRQGRDLIAERAITPGQARRGTALEVAGLDGVRRRFQVPANTVHGTAIRLRGAGMPGLDGFSHGDLLVRIILRARPMKQAA